MTLFHKCKFCNQYSNCLYLKKGTVCNWNLVSAMVTDNNNINSKEYLSSNIIISKENIDSRVDIVLKK